MQRRLRATLALLITAGFVACDESPTPATAQHSAAPPADPTHPPEASARSAREARRAAGGLNLEGRFRPARDEAVQLTAEQRRMVRELEAIGYLSGSEEARGSGVTIHDRERAQAGLNFFSSGHTEGAALMDMDGRVLHRWEFHFPDAFENPPRPQSGRRDKWWRRAFLLPNGDVIAIITGSGVLRVDKDSKLVWAKAMYAHHDLAFEPNGDMWVMTRKSHVVPRINPKQPIVEDSLTLLDPEGNVKRSFSLLAAFENSKFAKVWLESGRRRGDIFHSNSVERLDGRAASSHPAFKEGNLLMSFLGLNAIAVIDPVREKVVWAHRGQYRRQHDPKILANGNLLLFDNQIRPGPSAVLEFDVATMQAVWTFRGSAAQPFFTTTCGTAERLENGNTVITETDFGRVLEVTREGEIVWEFHNPERGGEDDRFVASLPELIRLPTEFPIDWLDDRSDSEARQ